MPNSRTPRIIGRVVKFSILCLILLVNGVLIFRLCSSGDPSGMKTLLVNQPLKQAYENVGEDLILQYQKKHPTITLGEHNSGYFSVTRYVFIPEANQVQLVFRYNNSTIKHLKEDYGLDVLPEKEAHLFDVTLVKTTDLTPDDPNDNTDPAKVKKERYQPSAFIKDTESNSLYTFYRYVFDGISVEEDTVGVFADVYYVDDIQYEGEAYGRLCLYDNLSSWTLQKLSRADIKALQNYRENDEK